MQVRGAARLGSDPSSVLYRPSGALKFKLVAIGQYDQHWLGQRGAFLIWPDAVGGPVAGQVVLRLSLPAGARTIRMQFRGKHVLRNLTIAAGSRHVVRIPVCGTGPVELTFAAMWSGRIGDGRIVSAASQPPVFERNAQACAVGSKP